MSKNTRNEIYINAPFNLVWEMTNDLENWTNLFTEYANVEVLEHDGPTVRFRLTMYPDEKGRTWSWVSERTPDITTGDVRARRVEPGPFEYMNLHWTYATEGQGTRMVWMQDFHMRDDAPVNDDQMAERINRNSPIQMENIRKKIEAAVPASNA